MTPLQTHAHSDEHPEYSDQELDLQQRVADLVAGDLTESDARRLRAAMADSPQLQQEYQFWQQVYTTLPEAARPHTVPVPGPGMAQLLRSKLAADNKPSQQRAGMRSWWQAAPWAVAAAAVVALLVVLVSPSHAPSSNHQQVMVYDEYGESYALPSWEVESVSHQHASAGVAEEPRAWMGVLTRPMELRGFEQDRGLEIIRVADGSPASQAGLQRRDVIISIDDMSTATRWCLPKALRSHQPDEQVQITYWRAGEDGLRTTSITLGQQ